MNLISKLERSEDDTRLHVHTFFHLDNEQIYKVCWAKTNNTCNAGKALSHRKKIIIIIKKKKKRIRPALALIGTFL